MRIRLGFIYFLIGTAIAIPVVLFNIFYGPVPWLGFIKVVIIQLTFYYLALTEPGVWIE